MATKFQKRKSTVKSSLTRIFTQIEMQEAVDPNRRDPGVLEHLQELLVGAETSYSNNYNTLDVVSAVEEHAYADFETSANDSRPH